MTTMTEPTDDAHPRGARRRPDLRRPARRSGRRAAAAPDRLADGRRRVRARWPSHFPDRTVVTYDPRGVERSTKADPASASTPEQHADDLHRIIEALGAGPVDLFASSGGAVNALALVARAPGGRPDARRARAAARVDPARSRGRAGGHARRSSDTYQRSGFGAGMAQFIGRREPQGPDPRRLRAPAGARSGDVRAADRGRRHPDRPAARARTSSRAPTTSPTSTRCARRRPRIVLGAGVESEGEMAHRGGASAVAERLGTEPVIFPERPRRLPRRRVRPAGRAGRLRREAARGPRRGVGRPGDGETAIAPRGSGGRQLAD